MSNKIRLNIKNIKSIFEEQEIEISSEKPNILIGLNGSGKTSTLSAFNFLVDNKKSYITRTSRQRNNNEKSLKTQEEMIGEVRINYSLSEEDKINIDYNLKKLFSSLTKNEEKEVNEFSKRIVEEGITLTTDSNGNNSKIEKDKTYLDLFKLILKSKKVEDKIVEKIYKEILNLSDYKDFEKRVSDDLKGIIEKIEKYLIQNPNDEIMENFRYFYELFRKKPKIIYIKNAAQENNLKYSYNLNHIFENRQGEDRDKIKLIINFLYPDLNTLKEYYLKEAGPNKNQLKVQIEEQMNKSIKELLKDFSFDFSINISIDSNDISLHFMPKNDWYIGSNEAKDNSDGNKALIEFIITINSVLKSNNDDPIIVLADEPEKNLSFLFQKELKKWLKKEFENNKNAFLVYTTHSPMMYDKNFNIFMCERNEIGSTKILKIPELNEENLESNLNKISKNNTTKRLIREIFEISSLENNKSANELIHLKKYILYSNSSAMAGPIEVNKLEELKENFQLMEIEEFSKNSDNFKYFENEEEKMFILEDLKKSSLKKFRDSQMEVAKLKFKPM